MILGLALVPAQLRAIDRTALAMLHHLRAPRLDEAGSFLLRV
jgi:hypothetical protein